MISPAPTRRGRNRRAQDRHKPSQVRLERMFHVGYLREGDILRVHIEDTMHDFTVCLPQHHEPPPYYIPDSYPLTHETKRSSAKETSPFECRTERQKGYREAEGLSPSLLLRASPSPHKLAGGPGTISWFTEGDKDWEH